MCKGPTAQPYESRHLELQSQSQCDWSLESYEGVGTQKDWARDEGLVSHGKDLVLKATGGYSGILGFRDTK